MNEAAPLIEVSGLQVHFGSPERPIRAVDGVDFHIHAGETVALVGESGCGKSVTAMALARLVPEPQGRYAAGRILFAGEDVRTMSAARLQTMRGNDISYIFQDPGASLNPVFRVGYQIAESIRLHRPDVAPQPEVLKWLKRVGMSDPARAARSYPHELSGGMQQRAMIAMALACHPRLLVADEPTTALDVTVQAQIFDLLRSLQEELGMAILLITHNLALVAGTARRVYVMYAGQMVEAGPTQAVLRRPCHPYTKGLLAAVPRLRGPREELVGIEGTVPHPAQWPAGCRFHPRCPYRQPLCVENAPPVNTVAAAQTARCHFWKEVAGS
jgi:oligopeptide/dipeptide ABC transporter ATP-binding protein